jgi:hypothetical protein
LQVYEQPYRPEFSDFSVRTIVTRLIRDFQGYWLQEAELDIGVESVLVSHVCEKAVDILVGCVQSFPCSAPKPFRPAASLHELAGMQNTNTNVDSNPPLPLSAFFPPITSPINLQNTHQQQTNHLIRNFSTSTYASTPSITEQPQNSFNSHNYNSNTNNINNNNPGRLQPPPPPPPPPPRTTPNMKNNQTVYHTPPPSSVTPNTTSHHHQQNHQLSQAQATQYSYDQHISNTSSTITSTLSESMQEKHNQTTATTAVLLNPPPLNQIQQHHSRNTTPPVVYNMDTISDSDMSWMADSAPLAQQAMSRSHLITTTAEVAQTRMTVEDMDRAWQLLQSNNKIRSAEDSQRLTSYLIELGVESAEELSYLQAEEIHIIANYLKPIGARMFCQYFHLQSPK